MFANLKETRPCTDFTKKRWFILLLAFLMGINAGHAQIFFTENKGQWPEPVTFRAAVPGGKMYLERKGLTYHLEDEEALHKAAHENRFQRTAIRNHAIKITYLEAGSPQSSGSKPAHFKTNYFLGDDPAKWASDLKSYSRVDNKDVWPGIDAIIHTDGETVEQDYLVNPGADPGKIRMKIEGASRLIINEAGELVIVTTLGNIKESAPVAWQTDEGTGKKLPVKVRYILKGEELSFAVGKYNKRLSLYIDPKVIFATFSGSVADNFGFTATFDSEGNAYGGGTVYAARFPTTAGAFQTTWAGGYDEPRKSEYACDVGILKFSPDGRQLLYATYIGGRHNEQPHSMIVDKNGDLVIFGTTGSFDFPVLKGSSGSGGSPFQSQKKGGYDMFIVKLSPDGTRLTGSTFFGGSADDGLNKDDAGAFGQVGPLAFNFGDIFRGEVIVDSLNNILIASSTASRDLPMKGGIQSTFGGGTQDGCFARFDNSLTQLQVSTYIGGSLQDAGFGIGLDSRGDIFICGGTVSNNLRMISGAAEPNYQGQTDGYIYKINAAGNQLLAATFVGTGAYDQSYLIQIDKHDRVYVTGQTLGKWPVSNGVYYNEGGKQFISMYNNTLTSVIKSTVFGNAQRGVALSPSAFLVDLCGRVCVSGWGGGANKQYNPSGTGNTFGLYVSGDAYQKKTDGSDFYLIVLGPEMGSVIYASYFGGSVSEEHVDGGTSRFDIDGKVYQSVCGGCGGYSDFPTTPDSWSPTNKGKRPGSNAGGCNNAVFKLDLNSSNFAPETKDTLFVVNAGEKIRYDFVIQDKDLGDSVYVRATGPVLDSKQLPSPNAVFTADSGINHVNAYFSWQTNCDHISADTYVVVLRMRDNGCPTPRTSEARIRIVVKLPPPPAPPAIFCLNRRTADQLELNWGDFEVDKYTAGFDIVRLAPDGTRKVIYTIESATDTRLLTSAPGHLTNNYCYYIVGRNICGQKGDSTRTICSVPDKDSMPSMVYLFTVTVEDNSYVKVIWNKYSRDDFYRYNIYRKENSGNANSPWTLYKVMNHIQDTTMNDSNVNVHGMSYCYKVVVRTQCGLVSQDGNVGCTILLQGNSKPFVHTLNYNPYIDWQGGVQDYSIIRRDPLHPERVIKILPGGQRIAVDDSLDYDVGLYYYKVLATEGPTGKGATSLSNEIRLVQAPILRVPNVFTPNGDGINDNWRTVPVFVKDYHMQVYNRWGQFVWQTHNKYDYFSGIYKGVQPWNNVFIWQVTYTGWDNSVHFDKGNVTILP